MSNSDTARSQTGQGKSVLITGTGERAERLAQTARSAGHQVTVLDARSTLDAAALPRTIDVYLQLPAIVTLRGDNLVARVRSFLADGLLTRFALVEQLLPRLALNASVVLVAGNVAGGSPVPDDQRSRLALLQVLAHATRAELTEHNVRVHVVADSRTDSDIASFLFPAGHTGAPRSLDDGALPTGREYQDWRTELMGLVTEVLT